uniref:Uncharacterized protein n=1 Tax=Solanum tuberosum TaxID=4113 RepID=M0ZQG9_SOLTU
MGSRVLHRLLSPIPMPNLNSEVAGHDNLLSSFNKSTDSALEIDGCDSSLEKLLADSKLESDEIDPN